KEDSLLKEVCGIVAKEGGYCLAWIGLTSSGTADGVELAAASQENVDYVCHRSPAGKVFGGCLLAAEALRTGRPTHVENMGEATVCACLRVVALKLGCRCALVLPLITADRVLGVLVVYSCETHAMAEPEIELLAELAGDLAYGIAALRTRTERSQAENEVRKLLRVIEQSPVIILLTDREGKIEYVNSRFTKVTGYSRQEALGKNPRMLKSGATSSETYQALWSAISSGEEWRGELQNKKKNGELYWVSASISPLRSAEGNITHFVGIQEDVTEKKMLQAQFQQAQKMEGVGRLAGGVAHDFNNLMTAVLSYCSFLTDALAPGDPRRQDVEEIERTAMRAAELTRQLLAFSRRQIISPRVLSVNGLILGMDKMLRRIIGEDVELAMLPNAPLDTALADPGQMEQVVVNLAVNARDAMPGGGKLILETSSVTLDSEFTRSHAGAAEGEFVLLTVSDTGEGISEEAKTRLFEPFFTTKEQGKGTGLGLATCYGIVKQNGGNIYVESEPGSGSTFKIFLPRVNGEPENIEAPRQVGPPPGGTETVLVAEDETTVRESVVRTLQKHGYTVLSASDGEQALRLAARESPGKIDLLLTDIVMPQMSGTELAGRIQQRRPGLRILLTSGYTDEKIFSGGILPSGISFMPKPFSPETLLFKVREVLDR
ncbi:MAG: hypothetical protein A3G41_07155, partial [Elusimicrobia bacterium RIFCSPLOWO2_12_FULL_59_9]